MSPIFDWLFSQYQGVPTYDLVLEIIAVIFGFLSVWFAKKENIWVYPTGIISTVIFVYLLWKGKLLGDMLINVYYTSMSIYGWYVWSGGGTNSKVIPITTATKKEWLWSGIVFLITLAFVATVNTICTIVATVYTIFDVATVNTIYTIVATVNTIFDYWGQPSAYIDTFTTAIFFVGMWFMAKKKLENWLFWIIGDIISVPLYAYKGLIFTSFQFLLFTIIAIFAYLEWRQNLNRMTRKY